MKFNLLLVGLILISNPCYSADAGYQQMDSYVPKKNPIKSACVEDAQEVSDRDIVSYTRDPIVDWSCIPEKMSDYHDGLSDKVVKINEVFNNPSPPIELRYDKQGLDEMYKKMTGRFQNGAPILPISRLSITPGNILHAQVNRIVDINNGVGIYFDKNPEEFVKFVNSIKVVRLVYDEAAAPDVKLIGDNLVFYIGLNMDYHSHDIKFKGPATGGSNWFVKRFATVWPAFAKSPYANNQ